MSSNRPLERKMSVFEKAQPIEVSQSFKGFRGSSGSIRACEPLDGHGTGKYGR